MTAAVSAEWRVRVSGRPGAVPARSSVLVAELGTARGVLVRADSDGSFSAEVPGASGATIQITTVPDVLPPSETLGDGVHQIQHERPSTYLFVAPDPTPGDGPGRRVAITGHSPDGTYWRFSGTVLDLGEAVRVRGTLSLASRPHEVPYGVHGLLSRVFDGEGRPIPELGAYAARAVTPSGLPIERVTKLANPTLSGPALCRDVTCDLDLLMPTSGLPAGGYAVRLFVPLAPPPGPETRPADALQTAGRTYDFVDGMPLALLPRGVAGPLRPAALLFVDAPSQAARGVQAEGDEEIWGWSNRVAWQPATAILPRTDAAGGPIRYVLEPYLPQVFLADRDSPAPPLFAPELPGGSLTVIVTAPGGATTTLGPAPFRQIVTRTATTARGNILNSGGGNVNAVARLSTGDDAFRRAFERDGEHTIRVRASFTDRDGNAHELDGTYRVLVAEPMDLDLGTLPGTPLLAGEPINRAVQVHPPVPADITYRLRAWSGVEPTLVHDTTTTGRASAFGWFHDAAHHPSTLIDAPSEYRVDVDARYTDADGRLWAASWAFGGVVVDPERAIDLRGRRGIDLGAQDLARFRRLETEIEVGGNHFNFPYHPGDVAWQTDDDSMEVRMTVANVDEALVRKIVARAAGGANIDASHEAAPLSPEDIRRRFDEGHGPIFSGTASGIDPTFGHAADLEAYMYATVERPGVRVREVVKEDYVPNSYWRFGESYTLQPGVGPQGDLPNDSKLLFGGAVIRDRASGVVHTGGYAALWIEVPDTDALGSRVDSPFSPDATALFEVGGTPIRAFFEPTGVRPGSLLVEGDPADFGGYVVPLGPHALQVDVTSPGGRVRSVAAQANPWGHVHDTRLNFEVDEAGIWTVDVRLRACPPPADAGWPCLEGGLNDGRTSYVFYVASRNADPIPLNAPSFLSGTGDLDLGVRNLGEGHATVWMPGWTLDARRLSPGGPVVRYRPAEIAARFPNFDREGFVPGLPADQVTFTVLAKDPRGEWRGLAIDAWGARVLARR